MSLKRKIISESINWEAVLKMPFVDAIKKAAGQVYVVGGSVRDHYLGKDSKDVDLLVRNLPLDQIEDILKKFGRVDIVGKSFGVIKFVPNDVDLDEPIDIAVPRTERPMTEKEKDAVEKSTGERPKGYQAFVTDSNHTLEINKDLERRDFTINAITKDAMGKLYDPFNGMHDLKRKIIRMVSPHSFIDDPLRMLRAVQFAARFGFKIEDNTFKAIVTNAHKIKEISPERILIELEKIISKGNPFQGFDILQKTGLYKNIFGFDFKGDPSMVTDSKRLSEFLFAITQRDSYESPDTLHSLLLKKLKVENDTAAEIYCLELAWHKPKSRNRYESRVLGALMFKQTPNCFKLTMLPQDIIKTFGEFNKGLPKQIKELAIDGNELMALGFKGKDIGEKQKLIMSMIYHDKLKNNKEAILQYLKEKINVT